MSFADVNIRLIISRLRPFSAYDWIGTTGDSGYNTVTDCIGLWRDDTTTLPTDSDILAEWDVYLIEHAATELDEQERLAALRLLELVEPALQQNAADRIVIQDAGSTSTQRWTAVDHMLNREEKIIRVLGRLVQRALENG